MIQVDWHCSCCSEVVRLVFEPRGEAYRAFVCRYMLLTVAGVRSSGHRKGGTLIICLMNVEICILCRALDGLRCGCRQSPVSRKLDDARCEYMLYASVQCTEMKYHRIYESWVSGYFHACA